MGGEDARIDPPARTPAPAEGTLERGGATGKRPIHVLAIEDDPLIRRVLGEALTTVAGRFTAVATGIAGLACLANGGADLVVLDLGLPDMEGVRLCEEIRQRSTIPIVVLSGRHSAAEKVALLDAGADDYVTKPFDAAELRARISAQLRRTLRDTPGTTLRTVTAGTLTIDFASRTARRERQFIRLTPTEWELLRALAWHAGRTMTHRQVFSAVWGDDSEGDPQTYLRVHIANLRRKIEVDPMRPALIITEAGVGYRFERPA